MNTFREKRDEIYQSILCDDFDNTTTNYNMGGRYK